MTEVLLFGEVMAALRGQGPLRLAPSLELSIAGAEANVAIGLARLGHRTRWIGRVGDDELGELVRRTLSAEQVDTSALRTDPSRPTGLFLLERRIGEVVRVSYYRDESAGSRLCATDVLPSASHGLRLIHVSGVTPALSPSARECTAEVVRRGREIGATISIDINYRSRLWSVADARNALRPLMNSADIVFASVDELAIVAADPGGPPETAVEQLLSGGVGQVILKRGGDGASAYTADESVTVPARQVPVVDLVGAGDAFVAGYLSAFLDGTELRERLTRAGATASFAIAHSGDWEGLPTRNDLQLLDLPTGTILR